MVHRKVVHNQTGPDAWCSVKSFFNDGTTQESFSHRNFLKLSLTFSVILYWNVVRLVFLSSLLSCSSCFLRALQQNRALSRLLYLLNILQFVISCLFGLYKETIYLVESCSNLLQFRRSPSYSQCVCVYRSLPCAHLSHSRHWTKILHCENWVISQTQTVHQLLRNYQWSGNFSYFIFFFIFDVLVLGSKWRNFQLNVKIWSLFRFVMI